jgi:putative phosphoribosyl transferase
MTRAHYRDRADAGRAILQELTVYHSAFHDPAVLAVGLARGGVPVAAEIAAGLGAQLDVAVVRKLGVPGHEELALGAISAGRMVIDETLIERLNISESALTAVIDRERTELARRENVYRGSRPPVPAEGRIVILVDDGVATGATMQVAVLDARSHGAAKVVVAVPTAPVAARTQFARIADAFICPYTPNPFVAVGWSYTDFSQVSDDEVCALLSGRA